MAWEFIADTPDELAKVRQSLPEYAKPTVAGELFQMAGLLESLAKTDLLEYPLKARHTGENSVPDFQLESGCRRISVEIARVTTTNLEHAHSLQSKISNPSSYFDVTDLREPESFALKLKRGRTDWSKYVAGQLSQECRTWLSTWNEQDKVPHTIKELLVAGLNSIVDGPPIEGEEGLTNAIPPAEVIKVEGVPCEETARDRKDWLNNAFWEELVIPTNPTLMVSLFIRQNDSRMPRSEVLEKGFLVYSMGTPGPTLEEDHQIWFDKVCLEVQDKTTRLAGNEFRHGDEDWLVLWDRLGTVHWQLSARTEAMASFLAPRWKRNWFSRVFLQDEYFDWQWMFAASTSVALPLREK